MATTVENPFNTQQSSASGIVNKAIDPATAGTNVAQYTPETRSVDAKTQTAAGQVESMLANDNPLLQRARTIAKQGMNQRGLVNSSMAQGAGAAAMIDRVTPLAQQDANTYNAVASENMAAKNTAAQANVGEQNRFGLQVGQQQFEAKQADVGRKFTTSEREASQGFQAEESQLSRAQQAWIQENQQKFTSAQAELDRAQQTAMTDKSIKAQSDLQTAQQNFTKAQADLDRAQQTNIQNDQQAFQSEEARLTRVFQENQAKLDRTQQSDLAALQIKAQQAQIPSNFAASVSNTTMTGVNAIMADGNLNADQKKTAINNVVTYANSQIDWAKKFYGTEIPKITAPA